MEKTCSGDRTAFTLEFVFGLCKLTDQMSNQSVRPRGAPSAGQ